MAAAWTVEGSPLRDPGAASHATNTCMLAIGCAGQTARNVSPESDPVGCAGQAARNVSPETDPIGCAGQAAQKIDSESPPNVSQSQFRQ